MSLLLYTHFNALAAECQFPVLNNSVKVGPINSTVQGSKLNLQCKDGFFPMRPLLEAPVCSSNGTWLPDPKEYECQVLGNLWSFPKQF